MHSIHLWTRAPHVL